MVVRKSRKIKDKWKEKKWVSVSAPDSFNNVHIADIPITDEEKAKGRVIEVTLFDILKGDPSQYQYKLYFQIDKVVGEKATTIFKRYEYAKEFLRSLVRRGSSKINFVIDAKTKDGYVFRIKVIALSHKELNSSRQHAVRLIARKIIEKSVPNMILDEFAQSTIFRRIDSDIMAATKKIIHLRHVGLEKVKLVRSAEAEITLLKA